MSARPVISVAEIVSMLSARAVDVVRELFPAGDFSPSRCVVGSLAGEPGHSLSVYLRGAKPGNWQDYASGERGDILDLVAHVNFAGDKGRAVAWARRFLGLDAASPADMEVMRRRAEAKQREAIEAAEADRRRRRGRAWRIWGIEATPEIAGTPVEAYLAGRGIHLARLPSHGAIRFHSELLVSETGEFVPGMVAALVGQDGKFAAVHRTFLEADGRGGWQKLSTVRKAKLVLGDYTGCHISISKGVDGTPMSRAKPGGKVLICEGIEDALSLAMACPELRIVAAGSLGNWPSVWINPAISTRILYRDNDEKPEAIEGFERALAAHRLQCADVRVTSAPAGAKDANELLQRAAKRRAG